MNHKLPSGVRKVEFTTDADKIRLVARYFRLFSDIVATEFDIVCDPHGRDFKAAFLVAAKDVREWVDGLGAPPARLEDVDLSWADELLGNAE